MFQSPQNIIWLESGKFTSLKTLLLKKSALSESLGPYIAARVKVWLLTLKYTNDKLPGITILWITFSTIKVSLKKNGYASTSIMGRVIQYKSVPDWVNICFYLEGCSCIY